MFSVNTSNSKRGLLITIIAVLLLSGFLFTNAVGFHYLKHSLERSIIESELPRASTEAYSEITFNILPAIVASSMLANDRYIQQWLLNGESDSQELTQYLAKIKQNNNALISFLVSEQSQQYYNSEGIKVFESRDDPQASWYFDFIEGNETYELNVGANIDTGETPTVFINYKVQYHGKNIGVVGLGLELSVINNILERYKENYKQNIYFINMNREIVSRSVGSDLTTATMSDIPNLTNTLIGNKKNTTSFFEYENKQGHFLLNLRYIPEMNWWMLIEQKERTLNKVSNILYANMFIGLATVFVTLIIVSWVVNYFHKKLEILATTDRLTRLHNRQAFEDNATQSLMQSNRTMVPISVLLIDVDRFKDINDQYGHLIGDKALKEISSIIAASTRKTDYVARWGGEEFVVLAHNSSLENAKVLAEKIRLHIESGTDFTKQITVSIGITQAAEGDLLDDVIGRADIALYKAKEDGRNCIRTKQASG